MFDFDCWSHSDGIFHLTVDTDQFDDFDKIMRIVDNAKDKDCNKFRIYDYQGDYAMHCNTVEDAVTFCQYLDSKNCKWCNGKRYNRADIEELWYARYLDRTVFYFNDGTYTSLQWAKDLETHILEFDDFNWKKES